MMNPMRAPMVMLCTAVVFAAPLTSCSRPGDLVLGPTVSAPRASGPVQRLSQPQQKAVAGPVDPDNRIGAIFIDNGPLHVCTGSVVHSRGGNLMITAAHCLAGASQINFIPGFAGDAAPAPAGQQGPARRLRDRAGQQRRRWISRVTRGPGADAGHRTVAR